MPSARIHEAVAREINQYYGMDDILLRIGTISPDSWRNVRPEAGVRDKYLSHFWDFRKSPNMDGTQANDYVEFYLKYYEQLTNPFYFGYLIHLLTDQYWKTYVDPKYETVVNGVKGFILKDGTFHDNEHHWGYYDDVKLCKQLAKCYNLGLLPTREEDVVGLECKIDELNIEGVFGDHGSLNYTNTTLTPGPQIEESEIYDFNDILIYIQDTVSYIQIKLKELEKIKEEYDTKVKIAVDIDDTILRTKELEDYYWQLFLSDHKEVDPNRKYVWGDPELAVFWDIYREKMAFGDAQDGSQEAMDKLLSNKYVVDLLSARPLKDYASLKRTLVIHFEKLGIHYDHLNLGFYSKAQFLKEHGYSILIDNELRNVNDARSVGVDAILYGPYNPDYDGYQTSNWEEIPDLVDEIVSKRKYKIIS